MTEEIAQLTREHFDAMIASGEACLVYKHSVTCGRSAAVKQRVDERYASHADVSLWIVPIQHDRPLCDYVTDVSEQVHESPQLLAFVGGACVYEVHHRAIKAVTLDEALEAISTARS